MTRKLKKLQKHQRLQKLEEVGKEIEIKVPVLGESITEATIGKWLKEEGESISVDEPIVELETDKVSVEIPSPVDGAMGKMLVKEGEVVNIDAVVAMVKEGGQGSSSVAAKTQDTPTPAANENVATATASTASPASAKMMAEKNVDPANVDGSGKRGQILKGDVLSALEGGGASRGAATTSGVSPAAMMPQDGEERVPMTRLRLTIAKRLKEAQNIAAMLTTFNEVDMGPVMELRKTYKDMFEEKHGVKLGFMGFFTKAVCHALREMPAVNAQIDGNDIVYKQYVNVGVAVGTDKGLVVPVVRNAHRMEIAEVEKEITRLGKNARDGKLAMEDMQNGTFTISNGGVYGSLMSTPILNSPQSGILGMHKIQERPIVVDGEMVIRPMMYLALSYDHRIVDGKEAVMFLVRVKESLEDPKRLVLDL